MTQADDKLFAVDHPPATNGLLARVADFTFRRRRLTLLIWVVTLVGLGFASSVLGGDFHADYSTPNSDSKAADALISERFAGATSDSVTVVWRSPDGAESPATKQKVDAVVDKLEKLPGVGQVPAGQPAQVSENGQIALINVPLERRSWDFQLAEIDKIKAVADDAEAGGLQVAFGGAVVEQGGATPTWPGLVAALIILLIAFGSVVASGLPIVTALFGLGVGSMLTMILASIVNVPDWAPAVADLLAIGVGIDYALLVLTRFRDALDRHGDTKAALSEALTTAGRSVLVAGCTVVIAVMGLFLVGVEYMRTVALSTSISLLVVMVTALTLLPALLAMLGPRVNKWKLPGVKSAHERREQENDPDHLPLAARWSKQVQKRPWPMALGATVILLLIAAPALDMNLGFPDASNNAEDSTSYKANKLVAAGFGPGSNGPLILAVDLDEADDPKAAVAELTAKLEQADHVVAVEPGQTNASGDAAVVTVIPDAAPQAEATADLVETLRDDVIPEATAASGARVLIGGATPSYIDQSEYLQGKVTIFVSAVVLLSLLILLLAFRSPVIAIKAGVMNLLSVGAAFGAMTLAASGGWLSGLLGIEQAVPVAPFLPVIMFAILFGLSMDYEVFLMSRVREEYLKGRETHEAVTIGLARTARVITAAAGIMIAVFLSFALAPDVFLRIMGFGMATAIFVDATIVRLILVPAVLQLLGNANWWIPGWLDRVLPHWELERDDVPASSQA